MQWYRLLLLAAYGLTTVHALLCIVNGDDSVVFRFLSLVTLTFELGPDFCTMYLTSKCDRPTFSRSEVIMRTNKQTRVPEGHARSDMWEGIFPHHRG